MKKFLGLIIIFLFPVFVCGQEKVLSSNEFVNIFNTELVKAFVGDSRVNQVVDNYNTTAGPMTVFSIAEGYDFKDIQDMIEIWHSSNFNQLTVVAPWSQIEGGYTILFQTIEYTFMPNYGKSAPTTLRIVFSYSPENENLIGLLVTEYLR